MNLPNAITVGRIAAAPLIGVLPFFPSSAIRISAFALFVVAAVTDYVDGYLARSRNRSPTPAVCSIRSPTSCCSSRRSSR